MWIKRVMRAEREIHPLSSRVSPLLSTPQKKQQVAVLIE
jgi:hypothetical protein